MNRLLLRFIPVLLLAVLAIGLPVSSVLAAVCSMEDPECLFVASNATSDDPWAELVLLDTNLDAVNFFAPVRNYASAPNRLYSNGYGTTPYDSLGVKYVFDGVCSVTELYVTTSNPPGSNPARMAVGLYIGGSWTVFDNSVAPAGAGEWTYSINTDEVEAIGVQFTNPSPEIQSFSITGTCEGEPPTGGLTMPLTSNDLHPEWGMYDDEYVHELDDSWPEDEDNRLPVYAYTENIAAPVHAVQGGTVTAVDYDITTDCQTLRDAIGTIGGFSPAPDACFVVVPGAIRNEPGPQLFTVSMPTTARIIVRTGEDDEIIYNYFVSNPSVAVGDEIDAGCIIGEVMELHNPPVDLGNIDIGGQVGTDGIGGSVTLDNVIGSIQTGLGVTVVRRSFLLDIEDPEVIIVPLLPDLTQEPDPNGCGGNFSGCVNSNSSLLTLNSWLPSNGVTLIDGGGVSLPGGNGGSQIQQSGLVLDDATNYTLTVSARSTTAGDGFTVVHRIRLFAGSEIYEQGITTTFDTFKLEFTGEQLGADQFFGVVNRNGLGTDIEVRYICISEEDTPQLTNACYFKNHHFDDGPKDWTITPGITFTDGQAFTYDEDVIEQYAILDPVSESEAATYKITVGARLISTNAYTGQSGKYIAVYYKYPIGGSFILIDEIDAAMVAAEGLNTFTGAFDIEHLYVLSAEIELSEHENSLFSIQTIVEDSDNYLRGLRIDYICLQSISTDDGSFPGQDSPGGFIPPFYENCQVINTPQDNNISSWTYYHWQNLRRFFDCTLMVRLNKMAETMDSMFKTAKLFMRWTIATVQGGGRWLSTQLMPWLNGHFRNIATGQVTTVYEGGGGTCSDLFCVLESLITGILTPVTNIVNTLLSLLTAAANLFLTILTGIIGLGVSLMIRVFSIFNQATGLLSGLITAYSTATPATIEGMPTCTIDPESSPFCRAVWVLDNTILGGRWGALLGLILAISTIHLILWAVGEFRDAIVGKSGSTAAA